MKLAFALLFLSLSASSAFAFCATGETKAFECRTGSKTLSVCFTKDSATYTFGLADSSPELALTQALTSVSVTPWPGIGSSIWEDISFFNDGHTYTVFVAVDRMNPSLDITSGVIVERDGKHLASLDCAPDSITASAFAFSDAMHDAGLCYDRTTQIWTKACPD